MYKEEQGANWTKRGYVKYVEQPVSGQGSTMTTYCFLMSFIQVGARRWEPILIEPH